MPPRTARRCAPGRSRWTCSASTWPCMRASRRAATSARRSSATSSSTGMPAGARSEEPSGTRHSEPFGTRDELRALQLERLRRTVDHVLGHQPPGADRLRRVGVTSSADVADLGDVARLPFVTKADLREAYPF